MGRKIFILTAIISVMRCGFCPNYSVLHLFWHQPHYVHELLVPITKKSFHVNHKPILPLVFLNTQPHIEALHCLHDFSLQDSGIRFTNLFKGIWYEMQMNGKRRGTWFGGWQGSKCSNFSPFRGKVYHSPSMQMCHSPQSSPNPTVEGLSWRFCHRMQGGSGNLVSNTPLSFSTELSPAQELPNIDLLE